jgi:TolB-like protein
LGPTLEAEVFLLTPAIRVYYNFRHPGNEQGAKLVMIIKSKIIAVVLTLLLVGTAVFSLPHVAVLDTILSAGMDPTAAMPVTDKIIEELLNSGKFTVLDRANVDRILREKEFQLSSGIVRNEEIRQAGEYLGADYVVLANVSRVGSTYVISAKMIDVVTGEIAAQASTEKQGKIDVLLEIARTVGKQISGQEIVVAEAEKKVEEKKAEAPKPAVEGSTLAVAQLQELIRTRTHMKKDGPARMLPLAQQLSDQQRMMLYTSNRKDNAVTGLLLNLLVTSLGSWVQGDVSGALIELSLAVSGAVMMISGAPGYDYYGYYEEPTTGYYIGLTVLITDVVYMCVRPFSFQKQWNQKLAVVLNVPYLAILDPRESTFSLVPTSDGVDWRFGLNLVSIEY